jgi:hypothetical protein
MSEHEEFLDLTKTMWEQKIKVDELKKILATEQKTLGELQDKVLKGLDVLELEKQHIPDYGTVFVRTEYSVKTPKDPESKQQLFEYIRRKYGSDTLLGKQSINSQTLNAFYKEELSLAKQGGNINWKLPGVEEPSAYHKLGTRKG